MNRIGIIFVAVVLGSPTRAHAQQEAAAQEALLEQLARGEAGAVQRVVKQGPAIFPALTKLLADHPRDDNQSLIAFATAEIARGLGPKAKPAIGPLCVLLRSQDPAVAGDCARALGYIGADATPEVVKTLQ